MFNLLGCNVLNFKKILKGVNQMIKFFGTNLEIKSHLEKILNEKIDMIKQPVIRADMTIREIKEICKNEFLESIMAQSLILAGDFSLCSIIAIDRARLNKKTGFIAYEDNRPVNIRWL